MARRDYRELENRRNLRGGGRRVRRKRQE